VANILDGHPIGPWTSGDQAICDVVSRSANYLNFADDEVPQPTADPKVFTLQNAPNPASSLKLYLGGLRQSAAGDFTLSGKQITYTQAPEAGLPHVADYRY
jgi:hypothetical protein